MKKHIFMLSLSVIALSMTACQTGYVGLMEKDQKVQIEKAGGRIAPERYINIKNLEDARERNLELTVMEYDNLDAYNASIQEMFKVQRQYVKMGNFAKADSIAEQIDYMLSLAPTNLTNGGNGGSGGSGGNIRTQNTVMLQFKNTGNTYVKFRTGPLAGTTLLPGQVYNGRVPVVIGLLRLVYEVRDGSGSYTIKDEEYPVTKGMKELTFGPR